MHTISFTLFRDDVSINSAPIDDARSHASFVDTGQSPCF